MIEIYLKEENDSLLPTRSIDFRKKEFDLQQNIMLILKNYLFMNVTFYILECGCEK